MFGEIWMKFIDYHLKPKILKAGGQKTLSKIDKICPLAILNQMSNIEPISMHIPSLVKAIILKLSLKMKIQTLSGQITLSKIGKICPFTIPKQILTISMHTPRENINWFLLIIIQKKLLTDVLTDYGRMVSWSDKWMDAHTSKVNPYNHTTMLWWGIIRKNSQLQIRYPNNIIFISPQNIMSQSMTKNGMCPVRSVCTVHSMDS